MNLNKRNSSIDLLRFVSMLGIVIIHIIHQGGILDTVKSNTIDYLNITFLYYLVLTSVNVFALITGYLYIDKGNIKYSKLLSLLLSVLFYSVIIFAIFYSFNLFNIRNLGIIDYIKICIPPLAGRYWYITCYIPLFCIIPFLNKGLLSLSKKEHRSLIIVLFVLFCILSSVKDFFKINHGYSPIWLIYCYIIGAYIRMYNKKFSSKKLLLILFFIIIGNVLFNYFVKNSLFTKVSNIVFIYNSPFIVISSILIMYIFINMRCKYNAVIKFLSLTSFGVYLIHGNILIFDYLIKDNFTFILDYPFYTHIMIIIFASLIIYLLCSVIEGIRLGIFKVIKITYILDKIGSKFDKLIMK